MNTALNLCGLFTHQSKEKEPDMGTQNTNVVLKYWPLLATVASIIAAAAVLNFKVNMLMDRSDKSDEQRQTLQRDVDFLKREIQDLKMRLEAKKIVNALGLDASGIATQPYYEAK